MANNETDKQSKIIDDNYLKNPNFDFTDEIVEKENLKLSKFIGKSSSDLQINLGKPDEDFKKENGNLVIIYNTRKYGIPCERRFEVDSNSVIIGFVSNGCF